MNKSVLLALGAALVLGACQNYKLPDNVVKEKLESATLYRDTTFHGPQAAYIALSEELRTAPGRINSLLKNGYRVVLDGYEALPSLVSTLAAREDVRPGGIVLSAKDSTWVDGLGGCVIWAQQPKAYLQAHGGDRPVIRLDKDAHPETFLDLAERVVLEKMPLEIRGEGKASAHKRAEKRLSRGEVQHQTFEYAIKGADTLRLDVHSQREFDRPRPIILYSFGGGWQSGARTAMDNPLFPFYSAMARMGYVVVAIDYRLGVAEAIEKGELPAGDIAYAMTVSKGTEMERKIIDACRNACLEAVEDLFDATSYIVEHAAEWGGDPSRIVLCGGSAGACNSLMAEYLVANEDHMAVEHLPQGFRYGGVIPCAGALLTGGEAVSWKNRPAPMLFFHGSADAIVPYGKGYQFEGPDAIIPTLPEGTPYVLYNAVGQDHQMSGLPTGYMNHAIASFIERYVVEGATAPLTIEDRFTSPDGPMIKRYLLSGYFYPAEEITKWVQLAFPEAAGN